MALVRGGLISLPWIPMAALLTSRHFAKLALAVTEAGWLGSGLGPVCWGVALDAWGVGSFFGVVLAEASPLAAVVVRRPKATDSVGVLPEG